MMKVERRLIPVRSQHKLQRIPIASGLIGIACVAVMVRLTLLPLEHAGTLTRSLAVVPDRLLGASASPEQWFTLLTASFLHAGWLHLAGNILYLAVFGPPAEDRLGPLMFAAMYLAGGAAGLATHAFSHPASEIPLVGASAAISAVLAANLVLLPRAPVTVAIPVPFTIEFATVPGAFLIAVWVLVQVASALVAADAGAGASSIAWGAHIGGFAAGAAFSLAVSMIRPEK